MTISSSSLNAFSKIRTSSIQQGECFNWRHQNLRSHRTMRNFTSFESIVCGYTALEPSSSYMKNQIVACILTGVLFIPTVILNGISIITILRTSQLKEKVSYFLILMQSITDFVIGFIAIPLNMAYVIDRDFIGVKNSLLCWLNYTLGHYLMGLSLITLCGLSVERYVGVVHPMFHRIHVTKKRMFIYECCGALLILVLSSTLVEPDKEWSKYAVFGAVLICLIFITFLYTRIYTTAKNSLSSGSGISDCAAHPNTEKLRRSCKRELKLAKSCFLVVCTFALCFLLVIICASPLSTRREKETNRMMWSWSMVFAVLNSSLNSVIFFWSRTMFRKEAVKFLKGCYRKLPGT